MSAETQSGRELLPALANKLLSGDSTAEITVWLEDRGCKHEKVQTRLVSLAIGLLRPTVSRADLNSWVIAASQHLYREMLTIGDYAGALKALKQIADLNSSKSDAGRRPLDI